MRKKREIFQPLLFLTLLLLTLLLLFALLSTTTQESMPFLFGLDMLRRFQCSIDLSGSGGGGGMLRFPTLDASLPFLSEHEIPQSERFKDQKGQEKKEGEGGAAAAASGGAGAAAAAAEGAAAAAAAPATAAADPEKVARLAALGFDAEAASRALLSAGGNEELAASMLFGDS